MMLVMAALVLPVFNAEFLLGLLREIAAGTAPAANLGWLALFLLLEFLVLAVSTIQFTGLELSPAGLRVQFMFFWWLPVPWDQVIELQKSRVPWQSGRLLVLERLTPLHRLFGLLLCKSRRPVVPIQNQIEGYNELIATLEKQLS